MGRGRAFLTSSEAARTSPSAGAAAPVVKQFEQIEGRRVLIEGCEFLRLKPLLDTLAPREARQSATNEVRTAQAGRRLPQAARYAAQPASAAPRRAALREAPTSSETRLAAAPPRGLVLDYELVLGASDFTFRSDTTYWVDGAVNLYGTTRIEGGTVVKFSPYASLEQQWGGQVVCATEPFRPGIFSSKDDDSVGEVLPGSTGNPVTPEANEPVGPYLRLISLEGTDLQHLHLRYAPLGIAYDVDYAVNTLSHAQFVHCRYALFADSTTLHLRNVLLYDVDTALFGCLFHATAEHATIHQCSLLTEDQNSGSTLALTNSLLVRVTSQGNATVTTQNCGTANEDSVFATAGAGAHYLPANSPWRNIGTTTINSALREALKTKTTEAPQIHTMGYLVTDTTLNPAVARDTDTPDLGYHAEPIDHVLAAVFVVNATLTINPGTVVATAVPALGYYGFCLGDNAKLLATGQPTNLARLVSHSTVQEQATATWAARGPAFLYWDTAQTAPQTAFRCTELSLMQCEVFRNDSFANHTLTFQDSALFSGRIPYYFPMGSVGFTNCLFDGVHFTLDAIGRYFTTIEVTFRNNTFRGGRLTLWLLDSDAPVSLRNNAFDGTTIIQDEDVANSHNAYRMGADRLAPGGQTDQIVGSFNFQSGPLGEHYLPAGSDLINAGSSSAAEAGLYHYTTSTTQTKEAGTVVDVGLHYLALDALGQPVDTDGDGLADYLEDRNGNGAYDAADPSNFESTDSDGDGLPDDYELTATQTNPALADTGNTGISDGYKDPDGDGWTNLEEASLGTDPMQPNVGSLAFNPVGGNYASAQNVAVTCPTAGATIHYTLDGAEPTESDPGITSGATVTLAQTATLKARAWKTGWIPSDAESQGYVITASPQNQPPALSVLPLSGSTFAASDDIEFLVEAGDPDGTLSKVQLYRGDYKVAETADSPLRYLLKKVVTGTYTFTAKAVDNAGAVTVSSPITITVGGSGPVVTLVGAQPFFTSSPGTLLASIVGVHPGALTSLTLNSAPLVPRAGDFSLTVDLTEGENTFTLAATDNQSRSGQATAKVYLDSVAPVISITAPANNASFNTDRINVQGTFTEGSLKRITVNGVLAFVNGSAFDALNVPLAEGANILSATAEDLAGNQTSASITVTRGTTPVDPVQLLASPVGGFAPLQVTFTPVANVPGTLQQVLYDFTGDNATFQTANNLNPVTHTYATAGQYFPVVTIQTTAGRFSSPGGWNAGPSAASSRLRINVQTPPVQVSVINVTDPVDLKTTPAGHLYVLSRSTATIRQYDANATVLRSLSGIGSAPRGLDVDSAGNVYVALSGNHQVAKYNPTTTSFQLDATFGAGGRIGKADQTFGSGNGEFNAPFDVAVTPDGEEIAVSDAGNHRIQQFTKAGVFLISFGQQGTAIGRFNSPKGLAHDEIGILYVLDSGNNRIILHSHGLMEPSGASGTALGQFQGALHISASRRGIYVADTGNSRVQVFVPLDFGEGAPWTPFTPRIALSTQLGLVQPAAVSQVHDFLTEKLYIADTGNNRILLVHLPAESPEGVWNAMKQRLLAGDIEGALLYFAEEARDQYRDAFYGIGSQQLLPMISQVPAILPVVIAYDIAQYRFDRVIDGVTFTFPIEFTMEDGVWKIQEF
jgi:hypothetical protein